MKRNADQALAEEPDQPHSKLQKLTCTCSICKRGIEDRDYVTVYLQCEHILHVECKVRHCGAIRRQCPLCKEETSGQHGGGVYRLRLQGARALISLVKEERQDKLVKLMDELRELKYAPLTNFYSYLNEKVYRQSLPKVCVIAFLAKVVGEFSYIQSQSEDSTKLYLYLENGNTLDQSQHLLFKAMWHIYVRNRPRMDGTSTRVEQFKDFFWYDVICEG